MMIFKVVRWRNLLSTGNQFTEIQLNRSLSTLIIGNNGGGKSTIIDAITFALYGKPFRNINKGQLINSINGKQLEVELEFTIGTIEYKIVRGIKPNKFEIYVDGVMIDQAAASKDYQAYLEENIIRLNYKSFTQNSILASAQYIPFMQLPAASRREVIEDLLDISVFSKMNEVLKARVSTFKNELAEVERDREFTLMKLETQEKYIVTLEKNQKDRVGQIDINIKQSEEKITDAVDKIRAIRDGLATLDESEQNALYDKITKKEEKAAKLLDIQKDLLGRKEDCTNELLRPVTTKEILDIAEEIVALQNEKVALEEKEKVQRKAIDAYSKETLQPVTSPRLDEITKEVEGRVAQQNDLSGEKKNLIYQKSILVKEIEFLKDNSTCPTCTQEIQEDFRTNSVNEKNKLIDELDAKILSGNNKVALLEKELDELKNERVKINLELNNERKAKLELLTSDLDAIFHELISIKQKQEAGWKKQDEIKAEVNKDKNVVLTQINAALVDVQTRIDDISAQIKDMKKIWADANQERLNWIKERQDQILKLEGTIESEHTYVERLEIEKTDIISKNTDIDKELEVKKEIESQIAVLETQYNEKHIEKKYIDVAVNIMKDNGIKTSIIKKYIPIINKLINSYLQIMDLFVEYELDETFNEKIKSRHRDEFSYASFSEGEKARIDLAILFTFRAVAKMKSTSCTNLLLLDETFDGSIDSDGSDSISAILRTLQDTNVFCISHSHLMHDKFRNLIEFVKVNNYSIIKK